MYVRISDETGNQSAAIGWLKDPGEAQASFPCQLELAIQSQEISSLCSWISLYTHTTVCVLNIQQIISGRHCKGQDGGLDVFKQAESLLLGIWCRKSPLFPPSATLKLSRLCSYKKKAARVDPYLEGRGWWATICTTSSVKHTILLKFAVQRAPITRAQVKMRDSNNPALCSVSGGGDRDPHFIGKRSGGLSESLGSAQPLTGRTGIQI